MQVSGSEHSHGLHLHNTRNLPVTYDNPLMSFTTNLYIMHVPVTQLHKLSMYQQGR